MNMRMNRRLSIGRILVGIILASFVLYLVNVYFLTEPPMQADTPPPTDKTVSKTQRLVTTTIHTFKKPTEPELKCDQRCPVGKYAYSVTSGYDKDQGPTICFDGNDIVTPAKNSTFGRGVNIAVVSDKTKQVTDFQTFDTYEQNGPLVRYLQYTLQDHYIVLIASMDEMTTTIGDGRKWLNNYGSSLVDGLQFRDNFVMVGQRGLDSGKALEKVVSRKEGEAFSARATISGCLSIPMGTVKKLVVEDSGINQGAALKFSADIPNCGMKEACPLDHFAVHIFSGVPNKESPSVCVDEKYVMTKGLNEGGRGFNLVVYSPAEKQVLKTGRFDTYAIDSSNMEIFLETIHDGEILIAVTHDDAATNLKQFGIDLLKGFGATAVDKIKLRDVFYFIGQKGIVGETIYEQIEPHGAAAWPNPIDKTFCVPNKLKGKAIKVDPVSKKNEKRQQFCKKYDGYTDFCDAQHLNDPLEVAQLSDEKLKEHKIFTTPIIVIAGLNHNNLRQTLETLLLQAGLRKDKVYVAYDEKFPEMKDLIEVFGFVVVKLPGSTTYAENMEKALNTVTDNLKDVNYQHLVIIEEDLLLSPDFLSFMAYTMDAVEDDDTVVGISAWNANGYKDVSGNASLLYRVENLPGLGFMVKSSFYQAAMKGKMQQCCNKRAWNDWFEKQFQDLEMVIPDVSRVLRKTPPIAAGEQVLRELFLRQRNTNLELDVKLDVSNIAKNQYEEELHWLLQASEILHTKNVEECLRGNGLGFYIPETTGKIYAIYYEQSSPSDYTVLSKLCKCFGLFSAPHYKLKNLHSGLIRFLYKQNTILLVGSQSPYAKYNKELVELVSLKKYQNQSKT